MTDLFDIFCVCSPERFFDYRCTEVRPVRCSRKWPGAVLVPGHATAHFHTFPTSKACLMFGLDFDECTLIWLSIQMYTVDLQVESVELPLKLGCFVKTHHMIHMISPLCKDRRAWANSWVWLDSKQQLSEEILSQEILFIFSVSMSRRAGPTGCQHMFKHKKKALNLSCGNTGPIFHSKVAAPAPTPAPAPAPTPAAPERRQWTGCYQRNIRRQTQKDGSVW